MNLPGSNENEKSDFDRLINRKLQQNDPLPTKELYQGAAFKKSRPIAE